VKDRDRAPRGEDWDSAVAYWRTLPTDEGATFDKEVVLDAAAITPHATWGTNPAQVAPITGKVPDPEDNLSFLSTSLGRSQSSLLRALRNLRNDESGDKAEAYAGPGPQFRGKPLDA
jgi:homoaconitase/3-isopropylmalate dehydratase large subunit